MHIMYICKYCGKEFTSSKKLNGHVGWCDKNPNKRDKSCLEIARKNATKSVLKNKGVEVACKYCGKLCKLYGLKNHENYCKENPNRIANKRDVSKFNNGTYVVWNKGLTKDTDERVANNGKSLSVSYENGTAKKWCKGLTKETDERLAKLSKKVSDTINTKVENDAWHSSLGKVYHYDCNGYSMHGSWELALAEYLNSKNIKWIRPKDKFKYYFEDAWHWYHPDIYLVDYDIYIEVKGCITEKDFAKWEQFPKNKKLDIYFGDDFANLNIIPDAKTKACKDILIRIEKYKNKHLNFLAN